MLKRGPAAGAIAVLVLAAAVGGCSADRASGTHSPPPPPPSPTGPPSNAQDVPGATEVKGSESLHKPVDYPDRITVAITRIRRAQDKDTGPGALPGKPLTIFTLRFSNGSGKPLDLNSVQVTASYGAHESSAAPVYTSNLNDFSGKVAPAGTSSASYAFALPAAGQGQVTVRVKFDSTHKPAIFTGSLP